MPVAALMLYTLAVLGMDRAGLLLPFGRMLTSRVFASYAFKLRWRTSRATQTAAETAIAVTMPPVIRYAVAGRFPVPSIPMVAELDDGTCLVDRCEDMIRGASTWDPDAHIRDVIHSILLPCALRWLDDDCLVLDIGSNLGVHTLSMLQLGARVVSVEPQTDLCVASRVSIAYNGWSARSVVLCGGVSGEANTPDDADLHLGGTFYRYGGPTGVNNYVLPNVVPLFGVSNLVSGLPLGTHLRLVKIDTDSVDCTVAGQFINLMDAGVIDVGAFIFESWDRSCRSNNTVGPLVNALLDRGYTVYRTHITERSWDVDHKDTARSFAPMAEETLGIFREQFCQRFSFNLWVLDRSKATPEAVLAMTEREKLFQYIATKDPFVLAGYITKDL